MCSAFAARHVVAAARLDNAGAAIGASQHASLCQRLFKFPLCRIHCQGTFMLHTAV